MGHPSVDITRLKSFSSHRHLNAEPEIGRVAHSQSDLFAGQPRTDHPRRGFEGKLLKRARRPIGKTGETACAVTAHLRFAAISVVIAHPKISAVPRRLKHQDAVSADPAMAVAKLDDLLLGERKFAKAIVEQNEIVSRAVHFGEAQHLMGVLTYSCAKANFHAHRPFRFARSVRLTS